MSRMPTTYSYRLSGVARHSGCFYMTPPTEYHRYGYRGHRTPNVRTGAVAEKFHAELPIVCAAKADYVDGDTTGIVMVMCEGNGPNGGGSSGRSVSATFEYDVAGDGVTPGNVAVDISGATTAAEVAVILLAAIQTIFPGGYVSAHILTAGTVTLFGRGPKVSLSGTNTGTPGTATVSDQSWDDVALQSGRGQAIQFRMHESGPAANATRIGAQSLWLSYDV